MKLSFATLVTRCSDTDPPRMSCVTTSSTKRLTLEPALPPAGDRCRHRPAWGRQSTIDHLLKLVRVAGSDQRHLQSDLFAMVESSERLVEGLHAILLLS